MKRFRLARRCLPGFAPCRPAVSPARPAASPGRRWLWSLAGACLAGILAGWPALTGGSVAAPPADGPGLVLAAMDGPQAQVLNPGPPTGQTATAGNGQVTLSWTAPAANGGAAIIGYDVYQGTSSHRESASPVNTSLIAGTSYTVTGLTNGTTYYFSADAVNDAELHSAPSAEASATPAAPVTVPGAPTGLTATAGDAKVSLTWTAPAAVGSPPARYNVYAGTSPGFALGTPVGSTTDTTATVTGLADSTTYYFVVTAVDAQGKTSAASGEVSAEPTGNAVLTSKKVPNQVIVSLAAMAIGATLGALALAGQWLRRRSLRSRSPAAPPAEVRAVPEPGRPGPVSIHEIGIEETYTIRLEPLAAAIITTIEELTP